MRVFAFARRFPSLSQTFVLGQCTGLMALGADLTVFADGDDATGRVHPEVQRSGVLARTRHFAIPDPWWRRPLPVLTRLLTGRALTVRQRAALLDPRFGREALSLRLPFVGERVVREARAGRPAVLHAHFGPVGAMVDALREAGVVDAPLVTTFYGYDVSRTPRDSYRRLFANGESFLVLSEAMRARLVAMGAPTSRTHVHRLGVDLTRFAPASVPASQDGGLHLLSIARLVPKKGIADALRAVAVASRRVSDLRYTIIGDGALRGELERLAGALGIAARVRFAGWLAEPEVIATAWTAHAVLAPSVTAPDGDAEGTPVAILEAQALGLPVIATRHAGIPEVVEDGVTALLAAEHDVEALADAIVVLEDPAVRRCMGGAGRALIAREHDAVVLNRALMARYQALARA